MKIQTEHLQLLAREQARQRPESQGVGFDDLLARQMQEGASQAASPASPQVKAGGMLGLNPLLATQQVNPSDDQQAIMNSMDALLDQMDQYAATLGTSDVSLRHAYAKLQGIGQQMDQLRKTMQTQDNASPELNALCTEMDILATTETFKLNRGDYSAG
ncbi:MAG: hypothetical protein CSA21_05160 [Deltaproteobacteria bacterium]|nr:MAG: hypothetical protein CSA21_05160 [Deltaproteobacteria bacterium]